MGADNPYRYRGYRLDSETGYYYLQSRYYDPGMGRFINADELIGTFGSLENMNLYEYCNNNYSSCNDPSGNLAVRLDNETSYLKVIASQIILPETLIGIEQKVSFNQDHRIFSAGHPLFIEFAQGRVETKIIDQQGEQNGILNFYTDITSENLLGSSAGANLNILGLYLGGAIGFRDTGMNLGITNEKQTGEISVGVSLETLSVNLKISHTKNTVGGSRTNYTSISISPLVIMAIYQLMTTGDTSMFLDPVYEY